MTTVEHKFIDDLYPTWEFDTLIVGTFNPKIPDLKNPRNNEIDFFYGREKNLFWDVMPRIFGKETHINATREEKCEFLKTNKIGLTDIIESVSFENSLKIQAEKNLLTYLDKDLDYFVPKTGQNVSVKITDFDRVLFSRKGQIKRIILTRQYPFQQVFMRDIWRKIELDFSGKVKCLWTPSGRGLPSKKLGLTKSEALFKKWTQMLQQ